VLSDCCLFVLSVCLSVMLVYCGQMVGWIKIKLDMEVGLGPATLFQMETQLPSPNGEQPLPNFRLMSVVAKRLDGSRCHLVGR